jgi:tol-pal system protein YbgF
LRHNFDRRQQVWYESTVTAASMTLARPNLTTLRAAVFLLTGVALAVPLHPAAAQMSATDLVMRIDQLERTLRQLTGTVEELQYRNQQLDQQVKRLTDELDGRQQSGTIRPQQGQMRPGAIPPPAAAPPVTAAPTQGGRRGDAFDPSANPNAPGVPRALGGGSGPRSEAGEPSYQTGGARMPGSALPPAGNPIIANEEPGVPDGREPGAPLDLSTLASAAAGDPQLAPRVARDPAAGAQMATLPPSQTPRDEYDLAYGYVLRKDYALAEQEFRTFLRKYPSDRMAADAQFWLGETMFQRQQYREAADAFVAMSKKYENHQKAPDALLRLGQSLGALSERELACATFGEVSRKYPRASLSVKQAAEREQKRLKC